MTSLKLYQIPRLWAVRAVKAGWGLGPPRPPLPGSLPSEGSALTPALSRPPPPDSDFSLDAAPPPFYRGERG